MTGVASIEQVAGRVALGSDLEGTLRGIAEAARRTMHAHRATLYVLDVDMVRIASVYTTETDEREREFLERAVGLGPDQLPLWRLQLASTDPVLAIEDTASAPQITSRLRERLGSGALIGVRLEHSSIRHGPSVALLGTLFCSYRHIRDFSAADHEAALGLAGLATLALANARLKQQTEAVLAAADSMAAEQMALRRVATTVAGANANPAGIFRQTAEEVAGLLGVELGLVARFDQGHAVPVAWSGHALDIETLPLDGGGALAQVASTGQAARVSSYADLADERVGRIASSLGYRSGVAVPVHVTGEKWGALLAATTKPTPIAPEAEARLGRFAELVAMAIANAEARERLVAQAATDPLTGLLNRELCVGRVAEALVRAERAGTSVAVLLLDVDEFKVINDTFGHAAGDGILVDLAGRLRAICREGETIARMGGDEFVIIAEGIRDQADVLSLAERIQSVFGASFVIPGAVRGAVRQMTASLGVAISGARSHASDLVRDADTAMYRVKKSGKDGTRVFDHVHRDEFLKRVAVEEGLRRAVRAAELEVYFQPIVDPATERTRAVEALSRWRHPRLGWIQPGEFIPIAEESGLIVSLGQHVLREAVRQTAIWRRKRPGVLPLGVFVNVSPRELSESGFVAFVAGILDEFGLDATDLALELTERVVIDDRDKVALATLKRLSELGIRLIIDDFGTGYSALSSLRRFPFAALKIDRCFVEEIDSMEARAPIIRALVGLAKTLEMIVIAEGVETQVQQDYLLRLGCDALQGFGIARPQSADAITELLLAEPTSETDSPTWTPAPVGSDDPSRVAALDALKVLDTPPEAEFDDIVSLVAEICEAPMAFVSLVDAEREYFKAAVGTELREAPRESSFCGHAIHHRELFTVGDARRDPRFAGNPQVVGGERVRFYAGAPLITPDGHCVGMLCIKDTRPRDLTGTQRHALGVLSRHVAALLELRRLRVLGRASSGSSGRGRRLPRVGARHKP